MAADCFRFPKESTDELPNLDPVFTFYISGESRLAAAGNNTDVLNDTDQVFLQNHIRKEPEELISPGGSGLQVSV